MSDPKFGRRSSDLSDHDILIGLVQTVNSNHVSVIDKITDVKTDVADTNKKIDTISGQYTTSERTSYLEARIRRIEVIMNWIMGIIGAGFLGGIVTFIINGGLKL